jgi:hypothetical protein
LAFSRLARDSGAKHQTKSPSEDFIKDCIAFAT